MKGKEWKMKKNASKKIVLCGAFTAFTAICALIAIPFGPVPINLAHLAIFISAWILGAEWAAVSQLIYIVLGVIGLPVFSGFSSGLGHILGPTGGFILAYPLVAYIAGKIFKSKKIKGTKSILLGLLIGWLVEYILGTMYYCFVTGVTVWAALLVCVVPFIVGDICKSVSLFFVMRKIKIEMILTKQL